VKRNGLQPQLLNPHATQEREEDIPKSAEIAGEVTMGKRKQWMRQTTRTRRYRKSDKLLNFDNTNRRIYPQKCEQVKKTLKPQQLERVSPSSAQVS
jgi:hypothetical protein